MRGISKESSQTDILPTVLDILNFPVPYAAMDNSLLDETAAHFAFTSRNEHILGFRYSFGIVEHTGTAHVQSGDTSAADEETERDLLSLNRAVYDLLVTVRWAPSFYRKSTKGNPISARTAEYLIHLIHERHRFLPFFMCPPPAVRVVRNAALAGAQHFLFCPYPYAGVVPF